MGAARAERTRANLPLPKCGSLVDKAASNSPSERGVGEVGTARGGRNVHLRLVSDSRRVSARVVGEFFWGYAAAFDGWSNLGCHGRAGVRSGAVGDGEAEGVPGVRARLVRVGLTQRGGRFRPIRLRPTGLRRPATRGPTNSLPWDDSGNFAFPCAPRPAHGIAPVRRRQVGILGRVAGSAVGSDASAAARKTIAAAVRWSV